MTLIYISTCAGGNHHTFQDDQTGERITLTTEEMDAKKVTAAAVKTENDLFEAQLPEFLKTREVKEEVAEISVP